MGPLLPDTSFLFSLYHDDAHTAKARAWLRGARRAPLSLSPISRYELRNALNFAVFRKAVAEAEAKTALQHVADDLASGFLQLERVELAEVFQEADRLSNIYTVGGGHRSFDILHVATAKLLKAEIFLTFDLNQRRLAEAQGLKVGPELTKLT
jgi:predicted nucleic acid-binding protein